MSPGERHSPGAREEFHTVLPRPEDLLAHREPFLFVSELTHLDPGRRAVGLWHLSGEEDFFRGHFPGRPTLPGVLMIEALAQVGAAALMADEQFAGRLPLFGGIQRARFRRQVVPGDTLELSVELIQASPRGGKGSGRATVGDDLACDGELMFILVDP